MERARKPYLFSDGREVEVWESTWETASKRSSMEERAKADKLKANGTGDPVYFYFCEAFYSYLASCSTGSVPSDREALELSDSDIDGWFLSVVSVNPENFLPVDYEKKGEVVFRDGSSFEIVSSFLPSVTMRRIRLEEEALKAEADRNNPKDIFAVYLYPLLASCSRGEIPGAQEVRKTWPESEIYKWRDAVEEINPHLFGSSKDAQARTAEQEKEVEKKSVKSRPRSRAS